MHPSIYFLLGLALGLGFWALASRSRHARGNGTLAPEPPSPPPAPQGERDVFIPGRNFDEMLARLGSGETMLHVVLNSMGEGVLLLNQADRVVLMNPSAERILSLPEKDALGKA